LEDVGVNENITLKWIVKKQDERAWNGFICPRIKEIWWALVNTVTYFRVPKNVGNFLIN
jgi:hypothetical protein